MKLTPVSKVLLFIAIVAGGVYGLFQAIHTGKIPRPNALKSVVPLQAEEINAEILQHSGNVKIAALPSTTPVQPCMDGNTRNCVSGPVIEIEHWGWNANAGLDFAVGGASGTGGKDGKVKYIQTSKGSLMEKYGVNVKITRQDETDQMKADLLDTVQRLVNDPNASGVKFITIMGDGGAQFFAEINPKLAKICPDCILENIATIGYSRGEDGFWGPEIWKTNCEAMRGGITIGVLKDGDWNIALKKLAQCGIPNNPDKTVYDPQAMNWIPSNSYTNAANDFAKGVACISNMPIKGKIGGGTISKCADAVVTWTPGDATVAKNRKTDPQGKPLSAVVPILTTEQSAFQMPCSLIGIRRFNKANRAVIENMIMAALDGGDQIRVNPAALNHYGTIAYALYNEESPAYWVKYYKGVVEPNTAGVMVHLGGSSAANLADAMQSFGLSGGPNLFKATYETFGKYVVAQYPKEVPSFPATEGILDTSYIQAIAAKNVLPTNNAESVVVTQSNKSMLVEGRRPYSIKFATGSAKILGESFSTLDQLVNDVLITKYAVAIHGHTDNTGTPEGNMALSQDRANSVAAYLKSKGVQNVIRSYAHGQEEPLASNATPAGQAKNRRVEIVVGSIEK